LAAQQDAAKARATKVGRPRQAQGQVSVVEVARSLSDSPTGEKRRYLKVVLGLSGAGEVRKLVWGPLTAAQDDTGRSLLPSPSGGGSASPGVQWTVLGASAGKHEYALQLPSAKAKKIAVLAGEVRVSVASRAAQIRFEDPLRAGGQTRAAGSRKVTLESLARHGREVRVVIRVEPPVSPVATGTGARSFSMTWQGKSTQTLPRPALGALQLQLTLQLADGSARLANSVTGQATQSASRFEVGWSGVEPSQDVRGLLCDLATETEDRLLPFRIKDITLP